MHHQATTAFEVKWSTSGILLSASATLTFCPREISYDISHKPWWVQVTSYKDLRESSQHHLTLTINIYIVYMYSCISTCIYVLYLNPNIYIWKHIHIYIYTCIIINLNYIWMSMPKHLYPNIGQYFSLCLYRSIQIYVCMHICMYIYIYMYVCTYICM